MARNNRGGGHPSGPSQSQQGRFRSAEEREGRFDSDASFWDKAGQYLSDYWQGVTRPGAPQGTAGGRAGQHNVFTSSWPGFMAGIGDVVTDSVWPRMGFGGGGSDSDGGEEEDPLQAYREGFDPPWEQGGAAGGGLPLGGGPPMPQMPPGLEGQLDTETPSLEKAWEQSAMIEQGYQQKLDQLREMYRFSETPEERAQIQFLLNDLEGQREAGHQIVDQVYGGAISGLEGRAGDMRQAAAAEGEDIAGLYSGAAGELSGNLAQLDESYEGGGMSVGAADLSGDATDQVAALNEAAPREAALSQRLGNIAAEDVNWLANTMGAEEGAHQGELERTAMQLAAQAQLQHQQQVQDRIARERMQFAQQAGSLANQGMQARQQFAQQLMRNPQQGMSPQDQWMMDRANAAHDAQLQAWLDRHGAQLQGEGGGESPIPTTPDEQMMWLGEMMNANRAMAIAAVRSGRIYPEVLEWYNIDPSAPEEALAPQVQR